MEAVDALREIAFQLERAAEPTYRVRAFRRAAQVVSALPAGELEQRVRDGTLEALPGIGKVTAEVITQATAGQQPPTWPGCSPRPARQNPRRCGAALRGDCHTHSDWSECYIYEHGQDAISTAQALALQGLLD